jgi:hypothetical protein
MDAADVAQIGSAVFTALAALAALLTVRQARHETQISRAALDADTQPLVTDVPRGVFVEEVEWQNLNDSVSLKRQDRSAVSVGTAGPEPSSGATVPVRNVGNGPARITDVTFISHQGDAATGWAANPVLPPGEMTTVGLWAAVGDAGVAVAASIGEAYEDFAVVVAYADAAGHPREAVRLDIANGQHPHITRRRWAQRPSELRS